MDLLETQYLPSIAWCTAIWPEKAVALDGAEHYQKGGLRNRCFIAGPNGVQRLSIPLLKGKHQQTPIREVRISYDGRWQQQHWRTIQAAYGKAPFFEHYADEIMPFYVRKWEFLFDYNFEIQTLILKKKLGWPGEFIIQENYLPAGKWPEGRDLRNGTMKSVQQPYAQVFQERHGFLPNLSVLDLLFCSGKNGAEVLAKSQIFPN